MLDGEGNPTEQVRGALYVARRIAAKGKNNILAYLIEAALEELDEHGLRLVEPMKDAAKDQT